MMSGKERREEILQRITNSKTPVSGAALAKSCEVSRQVIVQDIALIRAAGYDVIATNRGYICSSPVRETRVFEVNHTDEQMQDELNTIVDFGGVVLDVIVVGSIIGVGYDDHIIVGDIGAHGVVADDSLPVTAEIIPSYHDRFTIGEPALDIV